MKIPISFIQILEFMQCAQNTKKFISGTEQYKQFVMACGGTCTIEALVLVFRPNHGDKITNTEVLDQSQSQLQ